VEVEFARHDWPSLRNYLGRPDILHPAVRGLCSASSAEEARHAFEVVDSATVLQGRLAQAATAVASCLTHALCSASDAALTRILLMLSIIGAGTDEWAERDGVGPADKVACMAHVMLGFPFYCEVLESTSQVETKLPAIDLVCMCGTDNPHLTEAAIAALRAARLRESDPGVIALIENSLLELRPSL
jgi:hypothetical protein